MSWEQKKQNPSEYFHINPPEDDVEKLVRKIGLEAAIIEVMARLDEHPDDNEARRQAHLLVERGEEIEKAVTSLRAKI